MTKQELEKQIEEIVNKYAKFENVDMGAGVDLR